jgi:hypothetical protein
MGEQDLVLASLGELGILDAIVWAQDSAYRQVRQDYNPAGGHKQGWIGYSAYTYLLDRLDRVFQCGEFAPPPGQDSAGRDVLADGIAGSDFRTKPELRPGMVVRRDLNGSPGWMADGWRWLLASYRFGQVAKIRWSEKSTTKQTVAQQPHGVDDGGLFTLSSLPGLPPLEGLPDNLRDLRKTLVLAHAMDQDTVEFELFLGRIRWNVDHGDAWAWREDMLGRSPGFGGRGVRPQPVYPVSPTSEGVADADVRVRRLASDKHGPRAIGEA